MDPSFILRNKSVKKVLLGVLFCLKKYPWNNGLVSASGKERLALKAIKHMQTTMNYFVHRLNTNLYILV